LFKLSQKSIGLQLDETLYSKRQLLLVLEDLRIDYTPYYIHYYHSLKAIQNEYRTRPKLI